MKDISIQNKIIGVGVVLVAVFNPLSVNIWADVLVTGINFVADELVDISNYTVVVGGTLILIGAILTYAERGKKETARLKELKTKKTSTAGQYIEQ